MLVTDALLPETTSPGSPLPAAPASTPTIDQPPQLLSHADVSSALAAVAEAMELGAGDVSAIPAPSDVTAPDVNVTVALDATALDLTRGALDDIDLILPDISPLREAAGVPAAAVEFTPTPVAPAPTPCEAIFAGPDPLEVQRALDICTSPPRAPACSPEHGVLKAVDCAALQRTLDGVEDSVESDASDDESWPGSRRLSTVSSATAGSPEPTRTLSFTSAKPVVVPSASPSAAFPLGTERTILDVTAASPSVLPPRAPNALCTAPTPCTIPDDPAASNVWPDRVLAQSSACRGMGERPAVQRAAAAAFERRVTDREGNSPSVISDASELSYLKTENSDLRARIAELERLMEVHTDLYSKLERQQNEMLQIMTSMANEQQASGSRSYRRRTML